MAQKVVKKQENERNLRQKKRMKADEKPSKSLFEEMEKKMGKGEEKERIGDGQKQGMMDQDGRRE